MRLIDAKCVLEAPILGFWSSSGLSCFGEHLPRHAFCFLTCGLTHASRNSVNFLAINLSLTSKWNQVLVIQPVGRFE